MRGMDQWGGRVDGISSVRADNKVAAAALPVRRSSLLRLNAFGELLPSPMRGGRLGRLGKSKSFLRRGEEFLRWLLDSFWGRGSMSREIFAECEEWSGEIGGLNDILFGPA